MRSNWETVDEFWGVRIGGVEHHLSEEQHKWLVATLGDLNLAEVPENRFSRVTVTTIYGEQVIFFIGDLQQSYYTTPESRRNDRAQGAYLEEERKEQGFGRDWE